MFPDIKFDDSCCFCLLSVRRVPSSCPSSSLSSEATRGGISSSLSDSRRGGRSSPPESSNGGGVSSTAPCDGLVCSSIVLNAVAFLVLLVSKKRILRKKKDWASQVFSNIQPLSTTMFFELRPVLTVSCSTHQLWPTITSLFFVLLPGPR